MFGPHGKSLCMKNGMLRHSLGGAVIVISLQHFIAPALDLNSTKGAMKCC